eukprot:scaffold826_cov335-Pavlova_lutheri.AAC.20
MSQSWDGILTGKCCTDSRVVGRGRKPYEFLDVITHGAAGEATPAMTAQSAHRSVCSHSSIRVRRRMGP